MVRLLSEVITYKAGASSVFIENGVPHEMEAADTVLGGDVLGGATAVARWVLRVDESSRV